MTQKAKQPNKRTTNICTD